MRATHTAIVLRTRQIALATALGLAGCGDAAEDAENTSFDRWCDGGPCGWERDRGNVERVGTWHAKDYGVSFVEAGSQISQVHSVGGGACLRFDMIADVATEARVVLRLDFDNDGTVEVEQAVPSVRWKNVPFVIPVPPGTTSVRQILQKQGDGHAVLAQLVVRPSDCTATNTPSLDKSE